MTATYDSILAHCTAAEPSVVYVSIGCAGSADQQNPPFLDEQWPDEDKVIVLIDPALEEVYVQATPRRTVFVLRAAFHWPSVWNRDVAPPHVAFLAGLFSFAAASKRTQVIVQDMTGEDIRQYFTPPTKDFKHRCVLFDATYGTGRCSPDMKSAYIFRTAKGDFLQPRWLPLQTTYIHLLPPALALEMRERAEVLGDYVHRYYHVCKGTKEPRDWCSEAVVARAATRLFYAYGIKQGPLCLGNLRALLAEGLRDFGVVAGSHVLRETMYALIENPGCEYRKMLGSLAAAATDKTREPQ